MRVARYVGNGNVAIADEPTPQCPDGGLLVRTLACGLCSGELMEWYMDQKVPHVLGHEVSGRIVESHDPRFPVGSAVFPHHHAPCLTCEFCRTGRHVHCLQWKRTRLVPGGMADYFAVAADNLNDALITDDLRPTDAALIEPLACVVKSLRLAGPVRNSAVIGLGVMGLMHMLMLPKGTVGYDLNERRLAWAQSHGMEARHPDSPTSADAVFVCPGSQAAFDLALSIVEPGGTIVMFAPLAPDRSLQVPQATYFRDIAIRHSYSCGPTDTAAAAEAIRAKTVRAELVISHFIAMEELPEAYSAMKRGEILKPMVVFS